MDLQAGFCSTPCFGPRRHAYRILSLDVKLCFEKDSAAVGPRLKGDPSGIAPS
jgi:hypothetical protein